MKKSSWVIAFVFQKWIWNVSDSFVTLAITVPRHARQKTTSQSRWDRIKQIGLNLQSAIK